MAATLVSPHLIDFVLLFTIVEAVVLSRFRRKLRPSHVEASEGEGLPGSTYHPLAGPAPAAPVNRGTGVGSRVGHGEGGAHVWRPIAILLLLLPGICLLLAVRAALAGAPWPWVPAALTAALVAHVLDLRERWRN